MRDRRALFVLGTIAAWLLLLAAFVLADRSRERLAAELPRLRASIASLERDAQEVKRLRATPPAPPSAAAPLASLATDAGGVPGAQIVVLDEKRVRLTGGDVGFGALLEWLEGARASHGMHVESARLEALGSPGRVRAEVVVAKS